MLAVDGYRVCNMPERPSGIVIIKSNMYKVCSKKDQVLGVDKPSLLQATQERKVAYVPEVGVDYHPDKNNTSTIFAGTVVQQVRSLTAHKHPVDQSW